MGFKIENRKPISEQLEARRLVAVDNSKWASLEQTMWTKKLRNLVKIEIKIPNSFRRWQTYGEEQFYVQSWSEWGMIV